MAHPGGRPTKYTDEMPEKLIASLAMGKTIAQFACSVDVCVDTVYEWVKVYPKFSEAFKRGRAKSESFWTDWLQKNLDNPKANGALVKMYFVNCFGWADKKDQHITLSESDTPRAVRQAEQHYLPKK